MKVLISQNGYYYKEYKNGNKKRISMKEYNKLNMNLNIIGGSNSPMKLAIKRLFNVNNFKDLKIYFQENKSNYSDNQFLTELINAVDNNNTSFRGYSKLKEFINEYRTEKDAIKNLLNTNKNKFKQLKGYYQDNKSNYSDNQFLNELVNDIFLGNTSHLNSYPKLKKYIRNIVPSISELLNYSEDVYFTSFMEFLSTRSGRTNTEVLIPEYIQNNQIHTLTINGKHTLQFKIDKNNMLGFGAYGYVYDIPDHDVCIKFMFVNENELIEENKDLNLYLEGITKSKGLLPIKVLLLRKKNDSYSKSVFYLSGTNKRVRVYLMKKISSDLTKLPRTKLKDQFYVMYHKDKVANMLNKLMIQIDVLMKNSGTFGGTYNYIHKAQMFDLKPANIGVLMGIGAEVYLIDIDGYLYHKKRRVENNEWVSSYPPIEFYKNKTLDDGQHITVTDLEKEGKEYYATGKHISWMLGIVVYQMFCDFVKVIVLPKNKNNNKRMIYTQSQYGLPIYFNFLHHEYDRLKNCTKDNNLFTSLDSFINELPDPYKSQWTDGTPSFLDEIKSCLYFDDGIYDKLPDLSSQNHFSSSHPPEGYIDWSPEGLDERRPFYNADGTINFF